MLVNVISIHSLTRRLTRIDTDGISSGVISIHSLTRRLTLLWDFHGFPSQISIHSLTRRLTVECFLMNLLRKHFNSQPHKEADSCEIGFIRVYIIFQFTASQGGWPELHSQLFYRVRISIHSLTRRLTKLLSRWLWQWLFQFTASQGGWQPWKQRLNGFRNFNSQPHKEADHGETIKSPGE